MGKLEETPPARLNRRLVSECFLEHGAVSPHGCTPATEKTSQTEDAPASNQEQAHIVPEDDVVELHVGTKEL